jgi:two-component system sensor kinase FixL
MSELVEILRSDAELIGRMLTEKLQRSEYGVFTQAMGGDYSPILQAMFAFVEGGDRTASRSWAESFRAQALEHGLSFSQFLIGISGVEKVVRIRVVERLDTKKSLLVSLRLLNDAIDVLRRAYAEQLVGAADGEQLQSNQLLTVVATARDPICLATPHGKPFYLNAAARSILGIGEDEPIEATTLEPFLSESSWRELCDRGVEQVNRAGCWEGHTQLRTGQNQTVDAETKMFLIRSPINNRPTCLAIVHQVCEDAEKLSESLKESEATKNAILESSLDPIITIDYEGKITEFNKAAERVFERKRKDVIGGDASELLFPEGRIAGEEDRVDRYLRAGKGTMVGKRSEVVALKANGEEFPVELAMTMTKRHGEAMMTFFVRDISERKAAEEAKERHRQELERSNQELEQFAYVASHDLQEPLRKIRTFADRLESKSGDNLDESALGYLQSMRNAADRMQTLIQGLLTLSRVTTKGQKFVDVDLKQVAEEVVADLEVRIEEVQGKVEVGKLPQIQADSLQIRQLFQNLIGNALKFRREDEAPVVKIHGRILPEKSQLGRGPKEKQCRITVEDNGIGFDEKYVEKIFDVFQRLHPRDRYTGTGVGLAICKKIAERHGGTISATSSPGKGSKFTVIVPSVHAVPQ